MKISDFINKRNQRTILKSVHFKRLKITYLNFTHFRKKTHLLALELIFAISRWRVYLYIKFEILNEMLEWYKKLSLFAKWAIRKI